MFVFCRARSGAGDESEAVMRMKYKSFVNDGKWVCEMVSEIELSHDHLVYLRMLEKLCGDSVTVDS
jgi:hypothetical protein